MNREEAMPFQPKRLKRVVIKEELVELTGDFTKALILNQFIYWSERIKDVDKFIEEETERMKQNGYEDLMMNKQYGWIYKKSEELSEELMLGVSVQTMRRHLKQLIAKGWIHQRRNPHYAWDQTLQYRVDLLQIMLDLENIGYHLEGYEKLNKALMQSEFQNGNPDFHSGTSEFQNGNSGFQNGRAIPEITSEITYKEEEEEDYARAREHENSDLRKIYTIFSKQNNNSKDLTNIQHHFLKKLNEYDINLSMGYQILKEVPDLNAYRQEALDRTFKKAMNRVRLSKGITHLPRWFAVTVRNEEFQLQQSEIQDNEMLGLQVNARGHLRDLNDAVVHLGGRKGGMPLGAF